MSNSKSKRFPGPYEVCLLIPRCMHSAAGGDWNDVRVFLRAPRVESRTRLGKCPDVRATGIERVLVVVGWKNGTGQVQEIKLEQQ